MSKKILHVCFAVFFISTPWVNAADKPVIMPLPYTEFTGSIGENLDKSTAFWPQSPTAAKGAPNVLLIMTDDVGFAASSTFGGPVPTPNLDSMATNGLRYNNFHTTAMCSPTRAALLTGRNHHAVGTGALVNLNMGFPGYWSEIPRSAATVARVLKGNGYNTSWFGKNHNTPPWVSSATGPFDLWPTGQLGFEDFYGFMDADTNQWNPKLYRNTTPVDTSDRAPDLLLDRDLTDQAITWLHNQKANSPDKPFLLYFAPGTAHAPHHAPASWIKKFRGQFDQGWDQARETAFKRQKELGVIPANAVLTPRPEQIPAWDSLSDDQRTVYARYMEVFTAMLAYQDAQIGRLLKELERMGEKDNTLVIFIQGDNGGSGEGGPTGSFNELRHMTGQGEPSLAWQLANLDKLGGPESYPVFPVGWAWATNAPFPFMKQIASHLGGSRNGMVISWPEKIRKTGEFRNQFHHVNDIMPTILEAAQVAAPDYVDGIKQKPMDGVSLLYTFDNQETESHHSTQYFELLGNRAIYHNGWMANTTPERMPWEANAKIPPEDFAWELYNLRNDFSQSNNLAEQQPEKLKAMLALWEIEAQRNNVYPLRASIGMETAAKYWRPSPPRSNWVIWGKGVSLPWKGQPVLSGNNFTLKADLNLGQKASGVIVATGSSLGGWSFYLDNGKPVVVHARSEEKQDHFRIASDKALPEGAVTLRFEFISDNHRYTAGGNMQIFANDKLLAEGRIDSTAILSNGVGETFDVGFDSGGQVSQAYQQGGNFNGDIQKVEINLRSALKKKPSSRANRR